MSVAQASVISDLAVLLEMQKNYKWPRVVLGGTVSPSQSSTSASSEVAPAELSEDDIPSSAGASTEVAPAELSEDDIPF